MSKIAVNEITDEVGTGAPAFPNGMSATGAALTDPEITGGIYLGGTGSANKLDDYEEGTWGGSASLVQTNTSATSISITAATYQKIGNTVTVMGAVLMTGDDFSSEGDYLRISGLPFTSKAYGASRSPYIGTSQTSSSPFTGRNGHGSARVFENSDLVHFVLTNEPVGGALGGDNEINFTISYLVS